MKQENTDPSKKLTVSTTRTTSSSRDSVRGGPPFAQGPGLSDPAERESLCWTGKLSSLLKKSKYGGANGKKNIVNIYLANARYGLGGGKKNLKISEGVITCNS